MVGRWFGIGAFIVLALAMFFFDMSVLTNLIIPHYYSDFGLAKVIRDPLILLSFIFPQPYSDLKLAAVSLKDPLTSTHDFILHSFRFLEMTRGEIQQIVLWRPSLFNSGLFYLVLFFGYVLFFSAFVVGVVRSEVRKYLR